MQNAQTNGNASRESIYPYPTEHDGLGDHALNHVTATTQPSPPEATGEGSHPLVWNSAHLQDANGAAVSTSDSVSMLGALSRVVAEAAKKAIDEAFDLGRLQSAGPAKTGPNGDTPPKPLKDANGAAVSTSASASMLGAVSRVVAEATKKAIEEAFNLGRLQGAGPAKTGPNGDTPPKPRK